MPEESPYLSSLAAFAECPGRAIGGRGRSVLRCLRRAPSIGGEVERRRLEPERNPERPGERGRGSVGERMTVEGDAAAPNDLPPPRCRDLSAVAPSAMGTYRLHTEFGRSHVLAS